MACVDMLQILRASHSLNHCTPRIGQARSRFDRTTTLFLIYTQQFQGPLETNLPFIIDSWTPLDMATSWLPKVRVAGKHIALFFLHVYYLKLMRNSPRTACNVAPVFLDTARTVQKTVSLIHEAARNRADLVVFPETYIPAFPLWVCLIRASTEVYGMSKQSLTDYHVGCHRGTH